MKINLTPAYPYDFEIDNTSYTEPYSYDVFTDTREPSSHYVEFDGVVRTVKDFRSHIRSLKKAAEVRHDEMLRLAAESDQLKEEHVQEIALAKDKILDLETHVMFLRNRVTDLEEELNPNGDPEFLGDINYDSPEGKDIRLRNQRREIIRLTTALEDYRNHGRMTDGRGPTYRGTDGIEVFGVSYDEAYKRVRDYQQVAIDKEAATEALGSERRRNAELKSQLEYEVGRTGERVREVRELQEALRQKNEIIKDIREKVAEARIYE